METPPSSFDEDPLKKAIKIYQGKLELSRTDVVIIGDATYHMKPPERRQE